MTQFDKNILLAQYMGEKPYRRWRIWYNKERNFGTPCIATFEEAKLMAERELKWFNRWEEPAENFFISEPEEYDDWSHAINYFADLEEIKEAALNLPNDGTRLRFIETLAGIQSKYHPFFCSAAEWAEAYGLTVGLWEYEIFNRPKHGRFQISERRTRGVQRPD